MKNLLIVDVDGTLTTTKSGKPFKQSPDDTQPIDGAQSAITYFHNRGFTIFGVSNQGGCDTINKSTGETFKTVADATKEMQNTLALFPEIETIYFCPSMSGECCIAAKRNPLISYKIKNDLWTGLYRKPDIGMINEIEYLVNRFDKSNSLFVGDRVEDKQCAGNAGIPFIWANEWIMKYPKNLK